MSDPVILCEALGKTYDEAGGRLEVLRNISLSVSAGETVAISGTSGCGKSTLLHLLGGLDTPSGGTVRIAGQDIGSLDPAAQGRLRNRTLGFVYQFHHLLPEFTALENVAMPLLIGGTKRAAAGQSAATLLQRVGLGERMGHRPGELSGGERQRVAVARALVRKPLCVLADEPTGNLDPANAAVVFDLLLELNREQGTALVMVTHDPLLGRRLERRLTIESGRLIPSRAGSGG